MQVTILGCGSASGTPIIGCDCKVCISKKKYNIRSRSSIHIQQNDVSIIIDSGADFRTQCLKNNIQKLDAVIYTHSHADHIMGIDDLKSFAYQSKKPVEVYLDEVTAAEMERRFRYIFDVEAINTNFKIVAAKRNFLEDRRIFTIKNIEFWPMKQKHGEVFSYAFRFGNCAYSVDFNELDDENIKDLQGIKYWIVDCVGYKKSKTHSNLENTLHYISLVKPELAILTHMSHEIDYYELKEKLPPNVIPAYDGLEIKIS